MANAAKSAPQIERKKHFEGKVLKTTRAGAIVDIGLEKPGVVHISKLRKKPVRRVEEVVKPGDEVDVWVHRIDERRGHVELTMVEPLPLEWREVKKGMTVKGKVTKLEKFGAFIDIGAERPGLAHISELAHGYIQSVSDAVKVGDEVEAKVLGVNRRKKQIKLSLKALQEEPQEEEQPEEDDEPVPTAMEMAMRKAMENNEPKGKGSAQAKSRGKGRQPNEREDILARTLKNKVRTE